MRQRFSRTAVRLALSFAGILGLFTIALVVNQVAMRELAAASALSAELDHAKHAGHRAAALIREQYIHQAHTIIEQSLAHLPHYREAVDRAREAAAELERSVSNDEEKARAREIAMLARENDDQFRREVVPAVNEGDFARAARLHPRLDALVSRVVALNDELNEELEVRSAAARVRADKRLRSAATIMSVCCALAIVIAAVVSVALMRSILTPIGALREGALRVARGDMTTRITVAGKDEFAELASVFNRMTSEVARHQAGLVRSQRLAAIGQVAAGVAHEINNPLSVILGYVKVLRREAGDRGRMGDELRIVEDEALQCQRIVQGLLDVSRPPSLDLGSVDVADIARDTVRRLRESGRFGNVAVEAPPPEARLIVPADEAKLRQVVSNLLLNAIDATPNGGRIAARVATSGKEAVLTIEDSGRGISPEALPRVFDPFVSDKPRGIGLGLAISQAIADAHGGRIEIQSELGKGTRAELRLPMGADEPGERR